MLSKLAWHSGVQSHFTYFFLYVEWSCDVCKIQNEFMVPTCKSEKSLQCFKVSGRRIQNDSFCLFTVNLYSFFRDDLSKEFELSFEKMAFLHVEGKVGLGESLMCSSNDFEQIIMSSMYTRQNCPQLCQYLFHESLEKEQRMTMKRQKLLLDILLPPTLNHYNDFSDLQVGTIYQLALKTDGAGVSGR